LAERLGYVEHGAVIDDGTMLRRFFKPLDNPNNGGISRGTGIR
jgi:hypothetical protein